MVTFPPPNPALFTPEHPRNTSYIHANPSLGLIAGKDPIDAPATVEQPGASQSVKGEQPGMPGHSELPTADNTKGSAT